MESPDDTIPMFVPRTPTVPNEALREALLAQTTGIIRKRGRWKRAGIVAALFACYLAGAATVSLWRLPESTRAANVGNSIAVATPNGSLATAPTSRLVRPEDDQIPDPAAKQRVASTKLTPYERLREAGDMQLEQRGDIAAAARKYQQALHVASDHERAIALDQDSWLLMALKHDQSSTSSWERTQ